jgi:hypothetical protein
MSLDEKSRDGFSAIHIGSTVVVPQPDQIAFPLTRDKFELLQQGFISEERQTRDLALGIFIGTLVGVIGIIVTIDWNNRTSFLWLTLLLAILVASCFFWLFFFKKVRKSISSKGYTRIVQEIESHFGPK